MQVQLNFTFDLGSAAGQAEFQRMFGHLLMTTAVPRKDFDPIPADEVPSDNDPAPTAPSLTARQEAAAKARAAKAAKQPGPVEAVLGPDALKGAISARVGNGAADDLGDQMVGDDPDDMGLVDPSMSPAEAKEAGIVLVRQMYAAQKVAEVKKLQKEWGIAKFYDVPVERGHEFYRAVLAISHKVMGPQA